jgi:hypothetical protein
MSGMSVSGGDPLRLGYATNSTSTSAGTMNLSWRISTDGEDDGLAGDRAPLPVMPIQPPGAMALDLPGGR